MSGDGLVQDLTDVQKDEIEVIGAIYNDAVITRNTLPIPNFTFSLPTSTYDPVVVEVELPTKYPDVVPPEVKISSIYVGPVTLTTSAKDTLIAELGCLFVQGEVVLFQWFEYLRAWIDEKVGQHPIEEEEDAAKQESTVEYEEIKIEKDSAPSADTPSIVSSEPFMERKSTFLGHAARVTSTEQVQVVMDHLLSNKHIARATHNIMAYRIVKPGTGTRADIVISDHDDDGETAAGGRLSHLLSLFKAQNVVVVVTRWYGGVKLGPDRFKFINQAARDVLEQGAFL